MRVVFKSPVRSLKYPQTGKFCKIKKGSDFGDRKSRSEKEKSRSLTGYGHSFIQHVHTTAQSVTTSLTLLSTLFAWLFCDSGGGDGGDAE